MYTHQYRTKITIRGFFFIFADIYNYYRQHDSNLSLNPEIVLKPNNFRKTRLSEYSNAMHNRTVFYHEDFINDFRCFSILVSKVADS